MDADANRVVPATIKQITQAEFGQDEKFRIDSQEIAMVRFVGKVTNIEPKPTNTTYTLDDATATIEVQVWAESLKQFPENYVDISYVLFVALCVPTTSVLQPRNFCEELRAFATMGQEDKSSRLSAAQDFGF